MSAINYYLSKGYTPLTKSSVISGLGTISLWIPPSDKRVVLTNLSIASNLAGTIAFYFDNGDDRIAAFSLSASTSFAPQIGAWESTVVGGRIFAKIGTASASDAWFVNCTGIELGGR